MPGIDFYQFKDCSCVTDEALFGVIDKADSTPVQVTTDRRLQWGTTIENPERKTLLVLPVDKNVKIRKKDNENNKEKLCDFLMRSHVDTAILCFVELKDKKKSPLSEGIEQIGTTINAYKLYHSVDCFQYKRAYIVNGRHPHVQSAQANIMRDFKRDFGFVLRMASNIQIPT